MGKDFQGAYTVKVADVCYVLIGKSSTVDCGQYATNPAQGW